MILTVNQIETDFFGPGDLTDTSFKTKQTLFWTQHKHFFRSEAFFAKISVTSPWKLFIAIIKKNIYRIKVSQKIFDLILKKASLFFRVDTAIDARLE